MGRKENSASQDLALQDVTLQDLASQDLASQVCLMLFAALQELQQSEAETELYRIRNLITNVQSTLIELYSIAEKARGEGWQGAGRE